MEAQTSDDTEFIGVATVRQEDNKSSLGRFLLAVILNVVFMGSLGYALCEISYYHYKENIGCRKFPYCYRNYPNNSNYFYAMILAWIPILPLLPWMQRNLTKNPIETILLYVLEVLMLPIIFDTDHLPSLCAHYWPDIRHLGKIVLLTAMVCFVIVMLVCTGVFMLGLKILSLCKPLLDNRELDARGEYRILDVLPVWLYIFLPMWFHDLLPVWFHELGYPTHVEYHFSISLRH